jgi:hypothetical protein
MGRNPLPSAIRPPLEINNEVLQSDLEKSAALPATLAEIEKNAVALAKDLAYDGALTVESLEEEIKFYQRRSVEAVLEMGKRLLLLKEVAGHGDFQSRLEGLGIGYELAKKFMSATRKFQSGSRLPLLNLPNLNQGKLLELLVLDDSEIEALNNGDQVRSIVLDDVDCMSVSELRRALRVAQADQDTRLAAKNKLLADKQLKIENQNKELDELGRKARFVATASPGERYEGIRVELLAHAAGIEGALANRLRPSFVALREHLAEHGGECDAYLSSALGQIERAVREIREDFGLLRPEDVAPWANAE